MGTRIGVSDGEARFPALYYRWRKHTLRYTLYLAMPARVIDVANTCSMWSSDSFSALCKRSKSRLIKPPAACIVTGARSRSCSALLANRLGSTRATKCGGGRRDRIITCRKHQLELRATLCHEDNKRPLDYQLYTHFYAVGTKRAYRYPSEMSTMITFAANNEFFRKRKSTHRPCARRNAQLTASQESTARANHARSGE